MGSSPTMNCDSPPMLPPRQRNATSQVFLPFRERKVAQRRPDASTTNCDAPPMLPPRQRNATSQVYVPFGEWKVTQRRPGAHTAGVVKPDPLLCDKSQESRVQ